MRKYFALLMLMSMCLSMSVVGCGEADPTPPDVDTPEVNGEEPEVDPNEEDIDGATEGLAPAKGEAITEGDSVSEDDAPEG